MKVIITENRILSVAKKELTKKFGDLTPVEDDRYPKSIFYVDENGQTYLEYDKKSGRTYLDYDIIWKFLEDIFGLDDGQIKQVTKEWLKDHYNLDVRTTMEFFSNLSFRWKNIAK